MKQATLSKWLKLILIGIGICGLAVYFFIFPELGRTIVEEYPEFSSWQSPWLILIWISGIPCYAVLFLGWRIAANIGKDRSFSLENAKYLKWISGLAAGDSAYFFLANLTLLFLNKNHPGVVLLSMLVVFAGICVSVAAAALSHLVMKAAELQEQSDLTI